MPNSERREAGVGFAIKRDIVTKLTDMPHPVSDRIMTMRITLTKDRNATIVSAYAPTMANLEENKEALYSQLKCTLRNIPSTDKLLLIGWVPSYEHISLLQNKPIMLHLYHTNDTQ